MRREGSAYFHLIGVGASLYRRMQVTMRRARFGTEVKMSRWITSRSILENHSSTWLSQDEYFGMKCRWTCGRVSRDSST